MTALSGSEARLRDVPWGALRRLAASLDAPLAEIVSGAAAERVVDRTLRRLAPLDRDERAAVAEALFGVAVWRLRIDHALNDAAHPVRASTGSARTGSAARPELVEGRGAGRLRLAAFLRDLGGEPTAEEILGLPPGSLPPPHPPPLDLATRFSFPPWLADVLRDEAGRDAEALADALDRPGPICLRPNTLRVTAAGLAARLAREGVETRAGTLVPDALVVTSPRPNVYGLAAWHAGLFEVQDEGSQLVGAAADARRGDRVLDACAGAGGKALQLACAVSPGGIVHAADPDGERLGRLRRRAERAGAAAIVRVHGAVAPPDLVVDRVVVDAPCSELGALRRGPDRRFRIDPREFPALEAVQRELLQRAATHVRVGGRLVYATCTFRAAEDEAVAAAFEAKHPAFRRRTWARTWPHRHGCDAFFVAAWDRVASVP